MSLGLLSSRCTDDPSIHCLQYLRCILGIKNIILLLNKLRNSNIIVVSIFVNNR